MQKAHGGRLTRKETEDGRIEFATLREPFIDFAAMPDQVDGQCITFVVDLINDPVITYAQLHQPREGTGEGLGSKGIKVLSQPAGFSENALGNGLIKLREILSRFRQEFDVVHLPFQAQAAGNRSGGHSPARGGRLVQGPVQALLYIRP